MFGIRIRSSSWQLCGDGSDISGPIVFYCMNRLWGEYLLKSTIHISTRSTHFERRNLQVCINLEMSWNLKKTTNPKGIVIYWSLFKFYSFYFFYYWVRAGSGYNSISIKISDYVKCKLTRQRKEKVWREKRMVKDNNNQQQKKRKIK